MEVLHTSYISKANLSFENIDLADTENRNKLVSKTPTTTLPFLETNEGNISDSTAIDFYLAKKYKPDLLGSNAFESGKINQWIEFAACEINRCLKSIIYPIFGWANYCKDQISKDNKILIDYIKLLESELKGKQYLVGNKITLADIILFRYFRYFMMLQFPEGMRKSVLPNTTKWFNNIMSSPEAIKAYGRTILCKNPVKPYIAPETEKNKENTNKDKKEEASEKKEKKKKEENANEEEEKPAPKKVNPLDLLPPSKMDLDAFKREFLNNKNKVDAMKKFWEVYDPEGYSLWWIEYQMLPTEGKILFRTSNSKSYFLQKLDSFRKYCFAVHGVYGTDGDYKIRGVWMFRGKDIPQDFKDTDSYEFLTIRKLDHSNQDDKELVSDYWTKLDPKDKVQGRPAVDCEYFN